MKTVAGLWIDHRKAIIVTLSEKGEKTQEILSNVEKQLGRFKGKRSMTSFESQLVQDFPVFLKYGEVLNTKGYLSCFSLLPWYWGHHRKRIITYVKE